MPKSKSSIMQFLNRTFFCFFFYAYIYFIVCVCNSELNGGGGLETWYLVSKSENLSLIPAKLEILIIFEVNILMNCVIVLCTWACRVCVYENICFCVHCEFVLVCEQCNMYIPLHIYFIYKLAYKHLYAHPHINYFFPTKNNNGYHYAC